MNRKRLVFNKASRDLKKAVGAPGGTPSHFRFVTRSAVSATMRDRVKAEAKKLGIAKCDVWSGTEFEERLRANSESLLRRFVGGEPFPDSAEEIHTFLADLDGATDEEILRCLTRVFDRPAFYTPLREESNLPNFKKAITDTIEALNTGAWQNRDGRLIATIPSRHDVTAAQLRGQLQRVERGLAKLRSVYDRMVSLNELRPCGCGDPSCPVFMMSDTAIEALTAARREALAPLHAAMHDHGIGLDLRGF